jgi:hypothetical protein
LHDAEVSFEIFVFEKLCAEQSLEILM